MRDEFAMSLFPELDFPEQAARLAPKLKELAGDHRMLRL
jgi:hypothetical protein